MHPSRLRPGRMAGWLVIAFAMLLTIFPIYWMVRTSVTPAGDLYTDNFSLVPKHPTLINFKRVVGMTNLAQTQAAGGSGAHINFLLYLRNSVIYAGLVVVVQTLACSMAGYTLARLRFRGRTVIFAVLVSSLMIPPIFTLLPNFTLMKQLHLLNTFAALVGPSLLMTPFSIFFLRQFYLSIPHEVEEAAILDGANRWTVFWRVVMPISKGPLMTIGLTLWVWSWKDFLWPLLVAPGQGTRVLTTALDIFLQQSPTSSPDWTGLMAASTLTVVPVVCLLIFFGRRMVNAISFTGIK